MTKKDTANKVPSDNNWVRSAWNEFTIMSNEELKAYQQMLQYAKERGCNEIR